MVQYFILLFFSFIKKKWPALNLLKIYASFMIKTFLMITTYIVRQYSGEF